jgi:hypothetical protein
MLMKIAEVIFVSVMIVTSLFVADMMTTGGEATVVIVDEFCDFLSNLK